MGVIAQWRKSQAIKRLGPIVSSGRIDLVGAPQGEVLGALSKMRKGRAIFYFSSTSHLEGGEHLERRELSGYDGIEAYMTLQGQVRGEMGELGAVSATYEIREKGVLIRGERKALGTQVVEAAFYGP